MRRRVLLYLTLTAVVSACNGDRLVRPSESNPSNDISDATHVGAGLTSNPDFFFLPPMVSNPSASPQWDVGAFNPDLDPTVVICASRAATEADIATAVCDPLPTLSAIVDPGSEQYKVNWPVPTSATVFYRIKVVVGTTLLGYADVKTASTSSQLKNVNTDEIIPLVDGRTLPIKFRIERYALCEIPGKGPCATKAIDVAGVGGTVATPLLDGSTAQNGAVFAQVSTTPSGPRRTITVERCKDFRERSITDLPTFGPCVRVRVEPALSAPLAQPAVIFSCDVRASTVSGVVSAKQAERITLHRYRKGQLEALAHQHPQCGISGTSATPSLRGFLAQLKRGELRSAARQALAMLAPEPLYAARFIDLGGGGSSSLGDGAGASKSAVGGARLSVSATSTDNASFHEFQFLLPAKFDYISTATDRAAYPADALSVSVRVTDLGGDPVMNARVHFSAADDGSVSDQVLNTSSDPAARGIATVTWTVSAKSPNTLTASGSGIGGRDAHGPRDPARTPDQIDPFQPCDAEWETVVGPYACTIDGKPLLVGSGSMAVTAITVGNIRGSVIDAQTGAPVGDASVTYTPAWAAATTTASGGTFLIKDLTPGPQSALVKYIVVFKGSKYQDRTRSDVGVQPKATTDLGDVCLTPATGRISGTVVSTMDHQPIAPDAVTVTATQTAVPFSDKCVAAGDAPPAPKVTSVNATGGTFVISDLPPGNYSLTAHSEDYEDAGVENVVVKAAEATAQPAIALKWKFGNLSGTVVNSADRSPISGVAVTDGTNSTTSAADGTFSLRRLVPGAHSLTFAADGYVGATRDATVVAATNTMVGTVALDPIRFGATVKASPESFSGACPAEFTFTGTITGPPGAQLSYTWERSDGFTSTAQGITVGSAASATVSFKWVTDPSVTRFDGWQRLRLTFPDDSVLLSDKANVSLTCTAQ